MNKKELLKQCIKCQSKVTNKWYSGPKCEKCYRKERYELNKLSEKERKRNYYINNRDKLIKKSKKYSKNNREAINKTKRAWYAKNKQKIPNRTEYQKKYFKNRYNNDIEFKIKVNLRNRMNIAIKNNQKSGSAVDDLGCSVEELKKHLESQFAEGMSWDNWSQDGWHIDHIKPLTSFDLTDKKQFKEAVHYTNLQPMWAKDNLEKGST